jgi:hypothetical protein
LIFSNYADVAYHQQFQEKFSKMVFYEEKTHKKLALILLSQLTIKLSILMGKINENFFSC